jgi:hypothetical protein
MEKAIAGAAETRIGMIAEKNGPDAGAPPAAPPVKVKKLAWTRSPSIGQKTPPPLRPKLRSGSITRLGSRKMLITILQWPSFAKML